MNQEPLYLRCDCHTPYHCWVVERDGEYFNIQFVAESNGRFWHRVKYALIHIFKKDMLVESDMILKQEDADRLIAYLSRPQDG